MCARLITQTISQQPQVLLIVQNSDLLRQLQLLLTDFSLDVVVKEITEFKQALLGADKASLKEQDWYKVVWVEGFYQTQLDTSTLFSRQLKDFFAAQAQNFIVVSPLTTGVRQNSLAVDDWQRQQEVERAFITDCMKAFPQASLFLGQDVVLPQLYPTRLFFENLDSKKLLDPRLFLVLQTQKAFLDSLKDQLLRPRPGSPLVIRGKKRASQVVVKSVQILYDRFYRLQLNIKPLTLNTDKWSQNIEALESKEPDSELVKQLVDFMPGGQELEAGVVKQAASDARLGFEPKAILGKFVGKADSKEKSEAGLDEKTGESIKTDETIQSKPRLTRKSTPKPKSDSVDQELDSFFTRYRSDKKAKHVKKLLKSTKKGLEKNKHRKAMFGGGFLAIGIGLVLIFLTAFYLISVRLTKNKLMAFVSGAALEPEKQQELAQSFHKKSSLLTKQINVYNSVVSLPIFSRGLELAELGQQSYEFSRDLAAYRTGVSLIVEQIFGQKEGNSLKTLEQNEKLAANIYKNASLLQAQLKSWDTSAENQAQIDNYQKILDKDLKSLTIFQQLQPVWPVLLGEQEKRTYAVLLQNNQELRPTGGFIETVALLTFNQGKLVNTQVMNVYEIDNQLTAELAPPEEIQKYLAEERWFLRDSNWDPDFPTTAERVAWFIDKSLGVKVDGVLGLNLDVMADLIDVVGAVDVPEYNEVITAQNVLERVEFHSEVQLVDNANVPEYQQLVFSKVLDSLAKQQGEKTIEVLDVLKDSLERKELLVSLVDNNENQSFALLGWTGSMVTPSCPSVFGTDNCFVDSIAQVEANMGVNKANYYLQRQVNHKIELVDSRVLHKRVVEFKNTAQSNAWPKGPYKSFTRFYLPLDAQLESIIVDGSPLSEEQISKTELHGKAVYGVFTETPIQKTTSLEINYSIPYSQDNAFAYVFFDQKQPGTKVNSRVFLSHSPTLEPAVIAPQAEVQGNVIVFLPASEGHLFVGAAFKP